jgi:hypothetical protein
VRIDQTYRRIRAIFSVTALRVTYTATVIRAAVLTATIRFSYQLGEFFKRRNLTDNVAVSDGVALYVQSVLTDSSTASLTGLLVMHDYCDISYFAADYVGVSRTLT